MKQVLKLLAVALVFIIVPKSPQINKQAFAAIPESKVDQVAKPQTQEPLINPEPVQEQEAPPVLADNDAREFIFQHESGGNPQSINAQSGACGLGQAWPCEKLTNVCSLTDVDCQIRFFDQYAIARYGSWAEAMSFWEVHRWW